MKKTVPVSNALSPASVYADNVNVFHRAVNPPHLQILRNDREGIIDGVITNET